MTGTDSKPKLVIVCGTGTNNTRAVADGIGAGARDEGVDIVPTRDECRECGAEIARNMLEK